MSAGQAPTFKLEAFSLRVAVWETERTSAGGKAFKTYSVKLTKTYKNEKLNKWEETQSLQDRDLLSAAALLTEVWRTIAIKEGKPPVGVDSPPTTSVAPAPASKDEDNPF